MQWTGIYSRLGGGGGEGEGGRENSQDPHIQKRYACALQPSALPPPTPTIYMENYRTKKFEVIFF